MSESLWSILFPQLSDGFLGSLFPNSSGFGIGKGGLQTMDEARLTEFYRNSGVPYGMVSSPRSAVYAIQLVEPEPVSIPGPLLDHRDSVIPLGELGTDVTDYRASVTPIQIGGDYAMTAMPVTRVGSWFRQMLEFMTSTSSPGSSPNQFCPPRICEPLYGLGALAGSIYSVNLPMRLLTITLGAWLLERFSIKFHEEGDGPS